MLHLRTTLALSGWFRWNVTCIQIGALGPLACNRSAGYVVNLL